MKIFIKTRYHHIFLVNDTTLLPNTYLRENIKELLHKWHWLKELKHLMIKSTMGK